MSTWLLSFAPSESFGGLGEGREAAAAADGHWDQEWELKGNVRAEKG